MVAADASTVTLDQSLAGLADLARLEAWASAQQMHLVYRTFCSLLGSIRRGRPVPEGEAPARRSQLDEASRRLTAERLCAAEIGALLRVPEVTALALVRDAEALHVRCTATLQALEKGRFSFRHAQVITEFTDGLESPVAQELEARLIPAAEEKTVAQLRRLARRLREEADPCTAEQRHQERLAKRGVFLDPAPYGMCMLSAYLPADQGTGIFDALTVAARGEQQAGDPRLLNQLRADILVSLLSGIPVHAPGAPAHASGTAASGVPGRLDMAGEPATGGGPVPVAGSGLRTEVMVLIHADTLGGLDENPAELNGYGPISAQAARRLVAEAAGITGLTLDRSGTVAGVGRRRKVSAELKRWLQARDGTCRFPGCSRSARSSEIDHTRPWAEGGPTEEVNLAHLCRSHHRLKTHSAWHYKLVAPGVFEWTSPHSHHYRRDRHGTTAIDPPGLVTGARAPSSTNGEALDPPGLVTGARAPSSTNGQTRPSTTTAGAQARRRARETALELVRVRGSRG